MRYFDCCVCYSMLMLRDVSHDVVIIIIFIWVVSLLLYIAGSVHCFIYCNVVACVLVGCLLLC